MWSRVNFYLIRREWRKERVPRTRTFRIQSRQTSGPRTLRRGLEQATIIKTGNRVSERLQSETKQEAHQILACLPGPYVPECEELAGRESVDGSLYEGAAPAEDVA